jgi:hypothetical protein
MTSTTSPGHTDKLPHRRLHIVDADNLTGGPTQSQCAADLARSRYGKAAGISECDLVVVGSDYRSAAATAFAWPGARLVWGTGPDVVDELLLAELDGLAGRFDRLVIGSGDHVFADVVSRLGNVGVAVSVVGPSRSTSYELYRACAHVSTVATPTPCTHPTCGIRSGRRSVRPAA